MGKAINITVRDKIATNVRQNMYEYICGNSDFVIVFDFDEEWDEFAVKTARFKYNNTYQDVVFQGNTVNVPIIENTHRIQVGVFAGNLHTSTPAELIAKKSILCGFGSPAAPSDDVYNQVMQKISELMDQVDANGGASLMIVEVDGAKASHTAEEIYNHVQNGGSVIAKSSLYIFTLDKLNDYYANFVNVSGTRIASLSVDVYGAVTVTNTKLNPDVDLTDEEYAELMALLEEE